MPRIEFQLDFPAAHSMDTTWFAVDRDGRVAEFSSGESGGVPKDAGSDHGSVDAVEAFSALPECGPGIVELAGRVLPGEVRHCDRRSDLTLVFLARMPARDDLPQGLAMPVRTRPPLSGLVLEGDPGGYLEWIHAQGACLGCFDWSPWQFQCGDLASAARGFYAFRDIWPVPVPGLYGRFASPSAPTLAKNLPPKLRNLVTRVRFELSFEETTHLQPFAHFDCHSWGAVYLDADGKTVRPVPGREYEFSDARDALREIPGLRFEPPDEDRIRRDS